MLRVIIRIAISIMALLPFLLHNVGILRLGFIERIENMAYDARLVLTLPQSLDDRIVIVDVDEPSLIAEGQWPWPRDKLARLVDQLFDTYGVKVMGFDMVFPESDRQAELGVLEGLAAGPLRDDQPFLRAVEELRPSLERDRIFAESLEGRNAVLGFVMRRPGERGANHTLGVLPPPTIPHELNDTSVPLIGALGYSGNVARLQDNAAGAGFIDNPTVDRDSIYRRVPVLQSHKGAVYESLALAVTRAALDWPPVVFQVFIRRAGARDGLDLEWLKVGD